MFDAPKHPRSVDAESNTNVSHPCWIIWLTGQRWTVDYSTRW
jgi:hypothetical protein